MIRDISPVISPDLPVWPGDTPFSLRRVMELGSGDSCNVGTITTTVHVGAHVDAPLHFDPSGPDAARVELEAYVGRARVVHLPRQGGLSRADVEGLRLEHVERLLVRTREQPGPPRFETARGHLEPDAARWLGARGLRLFGIDTFSVDAQDSKTLDSHHALLAAGCRMLEGIDLTGVPEGDYELIALPLRLAGADASPVRAILRDLR